MNGSVSSGDSVCRSVSGSGSVSGRSIGRVRNNLLVDRSIGHLVRDVVFSLYSLVCLLRMYVGLYVYVLLNDLNEKC